MTELVGPAAQLARDGVELNAPQAYVIEILAGIVTSTPECAALFAPDGRVLRAGDVVRQPELADALERLGSEGAAPFFTGDIAAAIVDWLTARGGMRHAPRTWPPTRSSTATPIRVSLPRARGGHEPAAVGRRDPDRPRARAARRDSGCARAGARSWTTMERTQAERTPEFLAGLDDPEFVKRFLGATLARSGSTTHVAVLDRDGWACSVTCSNGSCSGVVVPGTGVHLNNMLGEQDLNPLGFHRHPPGRRMPSMMSPTACSGTARPNWCWAAPARTGSARRSCRRSSA